MSKKELLKNNKMKYVYYTMFFILAAIFVYSLWSIFSIYHEYEEGESSYEELENNFVIEPSIEPSTPEPVETVKVEKTIAPTATPKPKVAFDVDFDKLKKVNKDIKGWIFSPNTVINYPIMHTDNNEYYLDHLYDGTYNKCGAPFMDYLNGSDFSDDNSIIYAHHMKNGSMFASLDSYQKQSFYDKHSVMYILTPEKKYQLQLFSSFLTSSDSEVYTIEFGEDAVFQNYLDRIKKKSHFDNDVSVTSSDRIVTLSTCAYDFEGARYVVIGKLVEVDSIWYTKED